ncbi:MAG: Na(+)-translocating NADH-quinone reductase subunit A [Flavobacteriales bacterium]|nr:Na(+)-translocating NADH-quinone reductase subunit A [Flavobacteriales bacterium]
MSQSFKIRKGVDIRLQGEAGKNINPTPSISEFAVKPPDFHGLTPKMLVKIGERVKAGSSLFIDKYNAKIKFASPVSGEVTDIVRGAKRRILEVRIKADSTQEYESFSSINPQTATREEVIEALLNAGMWPFVRQRPFSIVANPEDQPKSIHVSCFDSAPLATDIEFALKDEMDNFAVGIEALKKLANGKNVNLGVRAGSSAFNTIQGVNIAAFSGPHPAGNVGVQIHKIDPINKGESVWYVDAQDVANIGRMFSTGKVMLRKTIALAGSEMSNTGYCQITMGAHVASLVGSLPEGTRLISGDVLTGTQIEANGYLGWYENMLTAIPEGTEPQFMLTKGWLGPGLDKFSVSRAFPTWLMPKSKKWNLNTNQNGEERAFVVTGQYEKVFPFDIYPVHLLKAIIVNDIDAMEKLGIYEVAPEDFALCEYACTSKIPVQSIVRKGLDVIKEECA